MSYNNTWGGTIPFPREKWDEWYDFWVRNPSKRFYRNLVTGNSKCFVGEAAYHYDKELGVYLADIIISAICRRQAVAAQGDFTIFSAS